MFDDMNQSAGREQLNRNPATPASRDNDALTDREVPLDNPARLSAAMHAWLDGEATEASARLGDASDKQVEMWKRIAGETETRRHMTTPVYLQQRIMAALPDAAPAAMVESAQPWYGRTMSLSPAAMLAAGAGLVAAGAAIGAALFAR